MTAPPGGVGEQSGGRFPESRWETLILLLVMENPKIPVHAIPWYWNKRWPELDIKSMQPVKKLTNAIGYVRVGLKGVKPQGCQITNSNKTQNYVL